MSLASYSKHRERYVSTGKEVHRLRMDRALTPKVAAQISAAEHIAAKQRRQASEKLAAEQEQQRRDWWTRFWSNVSDVAIVLGCAIVISAVIVGMIAAAVHEGHLHQERQQMIQQAQQQLNHPVSPWQQEQDDIARQNALTLDQPGWIILWSGLTQEKVLHVRGYGTRLSPDGMTALVVEPWAGHAYQVIPGEQAYTFSPVPPGKTSQP